MNCPIESHNFEREHSIKHMYLFRDSSGNILKARNLYFTTDDKVHFTGIKPSKNTTSALALKVFNEKICPMLNNNKPNPYFDIKQLYLWIREYALQDISLITKQYRVKQLGEYKTFSSVQAQISKMYGAGEHHLVTNHYIGAGKGIKVCKIEELMKVFGDSWIDAIDLNSYLSDLNEFILPAYRNLISKLKYENGELIYKTRKGDERL